MKKLKTLIQNDALRLTVVAFAAFAALFCAFPANGLLSTLPILVLAGLVIPFFFDEAMLLVPITAVSSVLLSFALTDTFDERIFYAIVPTLFFAAAFLLSRLLRLFFCGREKRPAALCGLVGALLLIGLWFLVFGNPVTLIKSAAEEEARYTEHYSAETFRRTESHYDPLRREYLSSFSVSGGEVFTAARGEDGYQALTQMRLAAEQKSALLKLLHENFSDGNYLITVHTPRLSPFSTTFAPEEPPEEFLSVNEITLEFDSAIAVGSPEAKASFAERVRRYVTLMNEAAFPYASITFRAGEYGEMVYEITATPATPVSELVAPNVTDLTR